MDLATLLIGVLERNRDRINAAAERFDGPIALELNWHPRMRKIEAVIRPSDRLPPFVVRDNGSYTGANPHTSSD